MSAITQAYFGSGAASRTGSPTSSRPGWIARQTSLTATQTCADPRWSVMAVAQLDTVSPHVALGRLPVPQQAIVPNHPGPHHARGAEPHHDFESIGDILARLRG